MTAIIVPLGLFFYFRMWRYRLRLARDLAAIKETNDELTAHISKNGLDNEQEQKQQ